VSVLCPSRESGSIERVAALAISVKSCEAAVAKWHFAHSAVPAYSLLGKSYLALSQLDNAAVELKRATENASLPFAHYYLGVLHRQQGRLDLAATEFEKEIEIAPGNASAYKDLAEIRLDESDVPGAVTDYGRVARDTGTTR